MKLKEVFPFVSDKALMNIPVDHVCQDTRHIKRGCIFFIKARKNFDIFAHIGAIEKQVSVFVAHAKDRVKIATIIKRKPVFYVADLDSAFLRIVDRVYGFHEKDYSCIAVTGTKGKSTVTQLIYELLMHFRKKTALVGTVKYRLGPTVLEATHTTPDFLTLRTLFRVIKKKKCKYVVMEVSSHGIAQERIKGLKFKCCVFTNLSREHLDYHKTMREYYLTKRRLFMENTAAFSIINRDDAYGRRLLKDCEHAFSYGIDSAADYKACDISLDKSGLAFVLVHKNEVFPVRSLLIGRHNVSNILAAIAAVHSLGFSLKKIVEYIPGFRGVEGRLEEASPDVYVDYAHTPDSLEKTLSALRQIGYKKVICVFGCGGDRDKGKRKLMGAIAGKLADFTFITSDNPRSEDARVICQAIRQGFTKRNYKVVIERRNAILAGLILRNKLKCACLVVAGKGHEAYQIESGKKIPFKDTLVIKELVNALDGKWCAQNAGKYHTRLRG